MILYNGIKRYLVEPGKFRYCCNFDLLHGKNPECLIALLSGKILFLHIRSAVNSYLITVIKLSNRNLKLCYVTLP